MFSSPFLPLPSGLEIATTEAVDDLLKVEVISIRNSSCCPLCFQPATRIHSHYSRLVESIVFREFFALRELVKPHATVDASLARSSWSKIMPVAFLVAGTQGSSHFR
jgi:hypothetical protein